MLRDILPKLTSSRLTLIAISYLTLISCQPFGMFSRSDLESTITATEIVATHRGPGVGTVTPFGCDKGFPRQWSFEFYSAFGKHNVQIEYGDSLEEKDNLIRIDRLHFKSQLPLPYPKEKSPEICQTLVSKPAIIKWQPEWHVSLQNFFAKLLPVCKMNVDSRGTLFCELSHKSADENLEKVSSIQKQMIRKWNRHSYLLARRIAVTKKMAAVMRSGKNEDLLRFCRLVSESLPEELPLSIRSPEWFDDQCRSDVTEQRARLIALTEAIGEIEFLNDTLRSNSRLGYLSLRIDRRKTDFRDFWIVLKPILKQPIENELQAQKKTEKPKVCWHPLTAKNPELAVIGSHLKLGVSNKEDPCPYLLTEESYDLEKKAKRYVKQSVASETEFAITNGRSKLLRLPVGNYQYTIEPQKHSFSEFYPNIPSASISQGTVEWAKQKPRVTINSL